VEKNEDILTTGSEVNG